MAKELPYFKFEPNAWDNGNIQMCSREDKGLFIDICSMYWSRLGDLPKLLVVRKLCENNATALDSLCELKILQIIDGKIFISFLEEQLNGFEKISEKNSENALKGWKKRRQNASLCENDATALNSQSENYTIREEKKREEEIRENEKTRENENFSVNDFLNESLKKINSFFGKNYERNHIAGSQERLLISARKNFTDEEIFKSWENASKDSWCKKEGFNMCTPKWLSDPENIGKYLNSKEVTPQKNDKTPSHIHETDETDWEKEALKLAGKLD